MNNVFSIWLVPQQKDEIYLSSIIQSLSNKYDAPVFIPHLTLLGNINLNLEDLKNAVDYIFRETKPIEIENAGLSQSENFTKTLFIKTKLNRKLRNLFKQISKQFNKADSSIFNPHISLLYKSNLSKEERLKIIKTLTIKNNFIINSVFIVNCRKPTENENDVENWEILYTKTLNH